MLELLLRAGLFVAKMLNSLLPVSPFTSMIARVQTYVDSMSAGLGMLNWLVDVDAILIVFDLWLLAIAAYYAFVFGVDIFKNLTDGIYKILDTFGIVPPALPSGD